MATQPGSEKCKYCWYPTVYEKHGITEYNRHHNGCPVHPLDSKETRTEHSQKWNEGWAYGFADNHIHHWHYDLYSAPFILGYRVGKDEIDRLVEQAAEANYEGLHEREY